MSIPTDPYNAGSRRPFDEGDVLGPISDETPHVEVFDGLESTSDTTSATPATETFELPDTGIPAYSWLETDSDDSNEAAEAPNPLETPEASAETSVLTEPTLGTETEATPDSSTANRVALAAAVGLGGVVAAQEETESEAPAEPVDLEASGFLTGTPEANADRLERWSAEPELDTLPDAPKGRGWTHTGVFFLSLFLVPVAWYLISDGHTRLAVAASGSVTNYAGAAELLAGIAVAGILWLASRASSLGLNVMGTLVALFGALGLALPDLTRTMILEPAAKAIKDYNAFTGNVAHHLTYDTLTGLMFAFGALMLLTGIVSHGTRRRGEYVGTVKAIRKAAGAE